MGQDTEVIQKAQKTLGQILIIALGVPIVLASLAWLFSTVIATNKSVAIIEHGMNRVVEAVENNTEAVKRMDKDNTVGHATIASMIYSVKEEVNEGTVRINALEKDCLKNHSDIRECQGLHNSIYKFEGLK